MADFAVHHEGMAEGTSTWVLHVDGDRLLLSNATGELYWKDIADCKLALAHTPSQATAVMIVQPAQSLVTAQPNRMMRRQNGRN